MLKLRPYQKTIIELGKQTLLTRGFVYLAMEVRTGKTLTSLGIADKVKAKNVLFVTKKKAISSIEDDFHLLKPSFDLTTINYESLHKLPKIKWDVIVCDESHSMGAFPKPSKRAKQVKLLIQGCNPYVILLSGTPTPESFSQMYHQIYGIPTNPFGRYKNFYRFCDDYVNVKVKPINGLNIRDYSQGYETILKKMQPYTINFSQKNAGFKVETTEDILYVRMKDETYSLAKKLQKTLVIEGKTEVIMGDTPVKLMSKLHQIYSGTVKFESGNSMVLDLSKAKFIKEKFLNKKIAIFYKFKEELNAIKEVYGETISTELSVFKDTDKSIALQIVSGREGISLKEADALIYYNIDFSATSYWQSRDRMTTKERLKNKVYWIFAEKGIENKIYKAVTKKKDYTLKHFKRDFLDL
tara:strand:+ start:3053 stop:4285 length:1233 start_codon:yes stop_codon:yes gene_type:complete